jgi:60 kDa SS-A/Ro ribonucleoprotein
MAKFRNANLANKLASVTPKTNLVAAKSIPKPDTKNIQGHAAYVQDKWLKLLSMLNTLKLESQYYKSEAQTMKDLKNLINECVAEDAYFTAQCIVYSRCVGEGMRSITQLAAVYMAPHVAGKEWGKRFYSTWNKKDQRGGVIFRPDDMSEIMIAYRALMATSRMTESKYKTKTITNAMKRGFKAALEKMDSYSLLKYKPSLLDVINMVRPNPKLSKAIVEIAGTEARKVSAFEAIVKGLSVSADTWEVAQSDAGQQVAKAVREGKLSKAEAVEVLQEAKAENWEGLLAENKLGILAALRNIRNILLTKPKAETIDKLCALVSNSEAILKGKIMPYQIDFAQEVTNSEFSDANSRKIVAALLKGYESSLPNLTAALPGNTLVMVDFSGSMSTPILDPNRKTNYKSSALDKAALIAATIAKATNGDIIRFGTSAEYVNYNANLDVFSLAKSLKKDMGGTSLACAWSAASVSGRKYTRVFILSDNECNRGSSYNAYASYVEETGDPYVYSVDLAAYGTTAIAGPKVRFYYGFGYQMFNDVAISEFNPTYHLDKVKKIVI